VTGDLVIRPATEFDWDAIHPIFEQVVREGETYAYPMSLTSHDARDLWMEQPPGSPSSQRSTA